MSFLLSCNPADDHSTRHPRSPYMVIDPLWCGWMSRFHSIGSGPPSTTHQRLDPNIRKPKLFSLRPHGASTRPRSCGGSNELVGLYAWHGDGMCVQLTLEASGNENRLRSDLSRELEIFSSGCSCRFYAW